MADIAGVVQILLCNSELANFEYWGDFILRLQRDNSSNTPQLESTFGSASIPSLFLLRLQNKWWLGNLSNWEKTANNFLFKGVSPIPTEAPLQAASLITKLGESITSVAINESGDLSLMLSSGESLTVLGTGAEYEESWQLELPVDDLDRHRWSIVCDAEGNLWGKFPGAQ